MSEPSDPRDTSEGAAFTPQQAFEFMQRMWNPLGVPLPGFPLGAAPAAPEQPATPQEASAAASSGFGALPFPNPAAMFAALDPVEIERKIGELRVIENWLTMTLGMMQMSIRTLELQKASLEALRGAAAGAAAAASGTGESRAQPKRKKG